MCWRQSAGGGAQLVMMDESGGLPKVTASCTLLIKLVAAHTHAHTHTFLPQSLAQPLFTSSWSSAILPPRTMNYCTSLTFLLSAALYRAPLWNEDRPDLRVPMMSLIRVLITYRHGKNFIHSPKGDWVFHSPPTTLPQHNLWASKETQYGIRNHVEIRETSSNKMLKQVLE